MPAESNIYDTNVLVQVVSNLKKSQNWLLNEFFPNIVTSESEEISIDVDVGKRRLAPFCSPLSEATLVEQRYYQTNTFKPPYIKDKRAPDLLKPVRRMIGERIGGAMSAIVREEANLAAELEDQRDILDRRMEWMAAQALQFGTVTVSGDGVPSTLIDFGRDSALTIALTGSAMWDSGSPAGSNVGGTAQPLYNLDSWATLVMKKSGAKVTDLVFSPTAWEYFLLDPRVQKSVWYLRSGDSQIEFGGGIEHGALYKGNSGQYRMWVYNDWYVDNSNTEQRMVADGTVMLVSRQLQGTRAFASILDPAFNYRALPYAPKSWLENDPAQRFLMMQSAPIVIPSRVNACLCATVTSAVSS